MRYYNCPASKSYSTLFLPRFLSVGLGSLNRLDRLVDRLEDGLVDTLSVSASKTLDQASSEDQSAASWSTVAWSAVLDHGPVAEYGVWVGGVGGNLGRSSVRFSLNNLFAGTGLPAGVGLVAPLPSWKTPSSIAAAALNCGIPSSDSLGLGVRKVKPTMCWTVESVAELASIVFEVSVLTRGSSPAESVAGQFFFLFPTESRTPRQSRRGRKG